jgi:hypothetical protein
LKFSRRYSKGLAFQTSYAFGEARESTHYSFRRPFKDRINAGDEGGVTHAIRGTWVYDLPFGRDRQFASSAGPLMDRLVGGWSIGGTARIQSGQLLDFGNVRLVGMSQDDLRDMFKLRFDDAGRAVYMLPQDVIDNTVKAWSVSATDPSGYGPEGPPSGRYIAPANGPDCIEVAQGYGDCGVFSAIVTGPALTRFDFSVVKRVPVAGNVRLEFRAELLNAFNKPWFEPVTGNAEANLSVTSPIYNSRDEFRVTELAGGETSRIVQIVTRLSW